jgi:hypothetical protein
MLPDDLEHFHNILRTTKYSSSLIKNYRFGPTCEFDHVSKGTSSLNSFFFAADIGPQAVGPTTIGVGVGSWTSEVDIPAISVACLLN